jgi:hypothetical protein
LHTELLRSALSVSGVCFDTIRTIGAVFPSEESSRLVDTWLSAFNELAGSANIYKSPESLDNATWRTLIQDLEFHKYPSGAEYRRARSSFRDAYIHMRVLFKGRRDDEVDLHILGPY